MKRIALALLLSCSALVLAAQDGVKVNFKGDRPTISDFVSTFIPASTDDEEYNEPLAALTDAWERHQKGLPQKEGETLTVDQRNGFVLFESKDERSLLRIEMCYWNQSDGKHKLFAYNVGCYSDGVYSQGQYDGLTFWRYDNASKTMAWVDAPGFDVEYYTDDDELVSYALPRTGKDIVVTYWKDGAKKQKTLKWDGRLFSF